MEAAAEPGLLWNTLRATRRDQERRLGGCHMGNGAKYCYMQDICKDSQCANCFKVIQRYWSATMPNSANTYYQQLGRQYNNKYTYHNLYINSRRPSRRREQIYRHH